MDCKTVENKIALYLDDELTLSDKREIETHMDRCPDCRASLNNLKSLGAALRQHAAGDAPSQLRANIRGSLKDITGEEKGLASWAPWLSLSGGGFALVAALIWGTLTFNLSSISTTGMTNEIIAAHVRSLLVDHMVDIRSTNTHTVKPWFSGKLNFSPLLKDLSRQGFLLAGGRLEYIKNKTGSALVYKRRKHIINVFTIHSSKLPAARQYVQEQGYNVLYWSASGLEHWIVSDLNIKELTQFADLYTESGHGTSF